jgi:hypothetical protein
MSWAEMLLLELLLQAETVLSTNGLGTKLPAIAAMTGGAKLLDLGCEGTDTLAMLWAGMLLLQLLQEAEFGLPINGICCAKLLEL